MNPIEIAKEVALGAGELLKKGFGTSFEIDTKEGSQNLVTEYDNASQTFIIDQLQKAFPSHHFLAEEGSVLSPPDDGFLWIIDPLDGTVNFAHQIPFFGVSIALAKGREVIAGVVYNPILDELFVAEKGSGTFLRDQQIFVTSSTTTERAMFATGFPYNVKENPHQCIETFAKIVKTGTPIRRMGVASLDLAYVAAGRFDAFWEVLLQPWDMAAGKLLVEEAKGKVTHFDGSEHQIFCYAPLLATNGHLHQSMLSYLQDE